MSELDRIKKQAHKDAIAHRDGTDDFGYTDVEDAVDDLVTVLTALDERDREIQNYKETCERGQAALDEYKSRVTEQAREIERLRKTQRNATCECGNPLPVLSATDDAGITDYYLQTMCDECMEVD